MYNEIGLKGKNRPFFENKLVENIEKQTGMRARRIMGRILVEGNNPKKLKYVFGVSHYAKIIVCDQDIEKIGKKVLSEMKKMKGKTMKVFSSRADKDIPKTSIQISREIGEILFNAGYKGNMKNPDISIFVEFIGGKTYIYFEKIKGPGGLPVGSSGKVVSLLSGGIDSPVSTWYAMKRGCEVICLHVHAFKENKKAEKSKIKDILKNISAYCPSIKCYFIPYYIYQSNVMGVPEKFELALFRRYLFKLAEKICEKEGAKAIYTGESLGQVASQTLESIYAVNESVKTPIMRPLIGFDKQEIICTAKYIDTYNLSITQYKDCCSIIARHPATKPKLERVLEIEKTVPMEKIILNSLYEASSIQIP